jgi:hypothetical protein
MALMVGGHPGQPVGGLEGVFAGQLDAHRQLLGAVA